MQPKVLSRAFAVPARPLERFSELYVALVTDRPWWQGKSMLRYCALALVTLPGEPRELATRLDALAEELKQSAPWYKRSSVGTMLAALLLRHESSVSEFNAELARAGELFRRHWRFSGSTYEALAIEVLRRQSDDRRVSAAQVSRMAAIYAELKQRHPWLTQKSDWPACALLSAREATPQQIAARIEAFYEALHARGFTRGDALQAATQVLYFHPGEASSVATRFQELYAGFKSSGLWMGSSDYDELAILCFAPQPPAEVLETVLRHRNAIRELEPAPDKQTSFTLACGTALLELARGTAAAPLLSDAQLLLHIQTILAAQQAAMAAAAASSS